MGVRLFCVFVLILTEFPLLSQESILFQEPVADLGTIIDNQGAVNHQFAFTNETADPLQVEKVSTTCGCTSTDWSANTIEPGGSGYVQVQFDPYNRPGPFEKHAVVHFKRRPDSVTLKIKGFVKPAYESVSEAFPVKMGDLRVETRSLDLGTITGRRLYSKSFEVYNEGDQILVFADDMEGPNHITVTFEPYTLKPKSKGKIWVHYDVNAKNDLGFFREAIAIFTYEPEDTRKEFSVSATLLDLPSAVSPESPRIHFDHTEIDFGIKQQGDTVNVKFTVQNYGRSPLQLKKVFGSCNCIRVKPEKYQLKPGEISDISVKFLTQDRLGNQEKTVTVFTDDPQTPVAILKLKGLLRGPRN